jgi:hypothetical protein
MPAGEDPRRMKFPIAKAKELLMEAVDIIENELGDISPDYEKANHLKARIEEFLKEFEGPLSGIQEGRTLLVRREGETEFQEMEVTKVYTEPLFAMTSEPGHEVKP